LSYGSEEHCRLAIFANWNVSLLTFGSLDFTGFSIGKSKIEIGN